MSEDVVVIDLCTYDKYCKLDFYLLDKLSNDPIEWEATDIVRHLSCYIPCCSEDLEETKKRIIRSLTKSSEKCEDIVDFLTKMKNQIDRKIAKLTSSEDTAE